MTEVIIEGGEIVIRVSIAALGKIVDGAWATGNLDTRFKVTDPKQFAEDIARELNSESEDGTTEIHIMFDRAIREAIDNGAEGVEEHEDQDA